MHATIYIFKKVVGFYLCFYYPVSGNEAVPGVSCTPLVGRGSRELLSLVSVSTDAQIQEDDRLDRLNRCRYRYIDI